MIVLPPPLPFGQCSVCTLCPAPHGGLCPVCEAARNVEAATITDMIQRYESHFGVAFSRTDTIIDSDEYIDVPDGEYEIVPSEHSPITMLSEVTTFQSFYGAEKVS